MVLFFKLSLLTTQMVIDDYLFFQVVEHKVAHTVSMLDFVRQSLVAGLELIEDVSVHVQIILAKDEFSRCWVLLPILYKFDKTTKDKPFSGSQVS